MVVDLTERREEEKRAGRLSPKNTMSAERESMVRVRVRFGDSQQLRLVRILRSTVMVRVGGGWMALDEFLVKNDPCRGKRTLG
ncbi:UNVERIFIED_CONTAM: hypothetical protein FKN15_014230 [Acipenser sinensis]